MAGKNMSRKSNKSAKRKSGSTSSATRNVHVAASDAMSGDRFVLSGQPDGVIAGANTAYQTDRKGNVVSATTCIVIKRHNGDMITKTYDMTGRVLIRETPSMRKVRKSVSKAFAELASSDSNV